MPIVLKLGGTHFNIGFKIMFLECVIGRSGIVIQLPPFSLARNIILKPIDSAQHTTAAL